MPSTASPALTLSSITKTFGTTRALDSASLTVHPNTIHALLGENGAGKTTLMRIAFGMLSPDTENNTTPYKRASTNTSALPNTNTLLQPIAVNGRPRSFHSSSDAIAAGIGMVHQHFTLVPAMTVAENIALAQHTTSFRYDIVQSKERVLNLSRRTGLPIDPDTYVHDLPVAAQQRVEILKALATNANILILDEPTAVLAPEQARELLTTLRTFANTIGTVILITHKLRDALDFADDITVLRHGKTVFTGPTATITASQLSNLMIGEPHDPRKTEQLTEPQKNPPTPSDTPPPSHPRHSPPVFRLRNADISNARGIPVIHHVSLTIHSGEIVGIAAVEGSGQHELLRVLSGRMAVSSGIAEIPDLVGFIPEDRHRDALLLDFSLFENIALFDAKAHTGMISWSKFHEKTATLMTSYDVRASSPNVHAATLSGGNQQKLVVAREIDGAPHALVAENPTRGLDIQASRAVHDRLKTARNNGTAIVVYTSDLDEVLSLSDRILVIHAGTLHEVPNNRELIGQMMLQGTT